MTATFVQVDPAELSELQDDPSSAEALFEEAPAFPPLPAMTKAMQDRLRTIGPQLLAGSLARLDPKVRAQLEQHLGRATPVLADAEDDQAPGTARRRPVLSLDKAWHGVHYLLSGTVEPGSALLSQIVMGGVDLGDDEDDFAGYGPARYFTAAKVAQLSEEFSGPEVEAEAAGRFDAQRMTQLRIYPGWRPNDLDWVMDALRRLRAFYADAAANKLAIVTCLL